MLVLLIRIMENYSIKQITGPVIIKQFSEPPPNPEPYSTPDPQPLPTPEPVPEPSPAPNPEPEPYQ